MVRVLNIGVQNISAQKIGKAGAFVGSLAVLAACSRPAPVAPAVPSTLQLIERTVVTRPLDSHTVSLPALDGTTPTSTIAFGVGSVNLTGTVKGPDGAVEGATVRVERIVGDQTAQTTVQTDALGAWKLVGVSGGIVRIQAYRAPDLALPSSQVVFARGDTKVDLTLERYDGTSLQWALAPSQPVAGRSVNLVVQVAVKRVDPDGFVRVAPLAGIGVTLVPLGALQPLTVESPVTDADGRVSFRLTCTAAGSSQVRLQLATGEESNIAPQPCAPPPTPPSTVAPVESVPVPSIVPEITPPPAN